MTKTWTRSELESELGDYREHALLADGYEGAIIGVGYRPGSDPIIAYDMNKCIDILVLRDGMSPEEAQEFFDFNTLEAWNGEGTPIYIQLTPKWKDI
jgi:hypothetical protein|tara:strand:- start:589 stop:879 length:291 start_codon:yes stop_codon:yes gene_type:complete